MTPTLLYGEREEEADSLLESTPREPRVPGRGGGDKQEGPLCTEKPVRRPPDCL